MPIHSPAPVANVDRIRIATPCPIGWEQMSGDNRVRFCRVCELNVYNISELSRTEAEALIASSEGRFCAKLYRRADGTVLTKDCPVGLRALRMRVSKRVTAVFAAIVGICSAAFGQESAKDGKKACTPQTKITRTIDSNNPKAKLLSGTVVDPAGAVVSGAIVTVTNTETKEMKSASTNDAGRFEFTSLAAGNYSLTVQILGFKSLEIEDLLIEKNKLTSIETILELSGDTVTIGVIAEEVFDSTPGTTIISGDLIRRLPLQ